MLVYEDDANQTPENETNTMDDFGPFTFEPDERSQSINLSSNKKKKRKKNNTAKRVNPVDIFNANAERQGNKQIMRRMNAITGGTPPTPLNVRKK